MATAEQLVAAVHGMVQDPGFVDADALEKINEGLTIITSEPGIVFQDLEAMATVNTVVDENVANLPSGCTSVYAAFDDDLPLTVYDSWAKMYRDYMDELTGDDPKAVAVKDATLMYLPEPATVTPITIFYYRTATPLALGATPAATLDAFTGQQLPHAEEFVKTYAASKLWDLIEDGIEGAKVNTQHYERLSEKAKAKLFAVVRQGMNRPTPPRNKVWR